MEHWHMVTMRVYWQFMVWGSIMTGSPIDSGGKLAWGVKVWMAVCYLPLWHSWLCRHGRTYMCISCTCTQPVTGLELVRTCGLTANGTNGLCCVACHVLLYYQVLSEIMDQPTTNWCQYLYRSVTEVPPYLLSVAWPMTGHAMRSLPRCRHWDLIAACCWSCQPHLWTAAVLLLLMILSILHVHALQRRTG